MQDGSRHTINSAKTTIIYTDMCNTNVCCLQSSVQNTFLIGQNHENLLFKCFLFLLWIKLGSIMIIVLGEDEYY